MGAVVLSTLDVSTDALVGFITGAITALVTEPVDCVTQRIMVQSDASQKKDMAFGYVGLTDGIRSVVASEGVAALWRGVLPRLILKSLGSAIWLAVYAWVLRQF